MNDLTIKPALARKRIVAIDSRLERYPDHPAKKTMLADREKYQAAIAASKEPAPKSDRLLNRFETLVAAIRKVKAALDADPKHPNKKRMLERLGEYQTSLKNIQEHGREKVPKAREGVKIEVPTDVLEQRSE